MEEFFSPRAILLDPWTLYPECKYYVKQSKLAEYCGRLCYASTDKITDDSYGKFINNIIDNNHLSVLEHAEVVLRIAVKDMDTEAEAGIKYSLMSMFEEAVYMVDPLMLPFRTFRPQTFNIPKADVLYIVTNERYFDTILNTLMVRGQYAFTRLECVDPEKEFTTEDLIWKYEENHRYTFSCTIPISASRELNRHRCLSISEQSTRYCKFTDTQDEDSTRKVRAQWINPYWDKSNRTYNIYKDAVLKSGLAYDDLLNEQLKPQQAREVLPLGLITHVAYTGFKDQWEDVIDKRDTPKAHPVVRALVQQIDTQIKEYSFK